MEVDTFEADECITSTIYAGSSILLLIEVEVHESEGWQPCRSHHVRQKSDELIEDLEIQLGTSQISYMQIKATYSHSAFPQYHFRPEMTGVTSLQSRMETLATASLKRHNTLSLWSPHPAPAPNPLFSLIERHWGEEKAGDAMQQILIHRSTPRKPAETACRLSPETFISQGGARSPLLCSHTPPKVPLRQTSLQIGGVGVLSLSGNTNSALHDPRQNSMAVASRDTRVRDASPASMSARDENSCSDSAVVDQSSSSSHGLHEDGYRRRGKGAAVDMSFTRKRRSAGADSIRALMPRLPDFNTDSSTGREGKARRGTVAAATNRERGKRETGRWGWTNWF